MIRQPIIAVLGHVDHGKTTLLDKIRGTAVQHKEAGGITQQIGATEIPIKTIQDVCGDLIKGKHFTIPGLLFIDTPGHAAFSSLRERGGSIADLAVLVIDVNQGVQPQTKESIDILRSFKVPFVIACNKIDLVHGWRAQHTTSYTHSEKKQNSQAIENLNLKLYDIMGQLSQAGFNAAHVRDVEDYAKTIALIPTSGVSGEGISELLMVLSGLSQKFLQARLEINKQSEGKGSIIEVKEEKGLGKTIDVILYNGSVRINDALIIGGIEKPIITKVKSLLKPAPLTELRQTKKYDRLKEIGAAAGIKIAAPDLEGVIPGMPFIAGAKDIEKTKETIQKQINAILVETQETGVVIKAESLGSLEALSSILKEHAIPIKSAGIGDVNKKDVVTAQGVRENEPYLGVIFAFNVHIGERAQAVIEKEHVKVFKANIIYKLVENYEEWKEQLKTEKEKEILLTTTTPVKLQVQEDCVFREFNPCIVGVEVIGGTLRNGIKLINAAAKSLGRVKGIQHQNENVAQAGRGEHIAISIENAKYKRDFEESDFFYSDISEHDFKTLLSMKKFLTVNELEILQEILDLKRKQNALWGM
ncbi:translation initiation factor IF-2 [archaeon CG10_big_fil_rev_8_21_14_0_10_43_11]|nr:MAG: translation initiation factor IF-2 [archaeon CG10_big_fil_rev_8_21_14_0_10_43_11]